MSIFSPKLGIDLGTANTLVYIPGKGIVLDEPSVVAITEHDHEILAIGTDAQEMLGKTVDGLIAHRPMRDGVIADYRMTTAMLTHFIKKSMGFWSFIKPEVMVSVPAGVTSTERRAVVEAAVAALAREQRHVVVGEANNREGLEVAVGIVLLVDGAADHVAAPRLAHAGRLPVTHRGSPWSLYVGAPSRV